MVWSVWMLLTSVVSQLVEILNSAYDRPSPHLERSTQDQIHPVNLSELLCPAYRPRQWSWFEFRCSGYLCWWKATHFRHSGLHVRPRMSLIFIIVICWCLHAGILYANNSTIFPPVDKCFRQRPRDRSSLVVHSFRWKTRAWDACSLESCLPFKTDSVWFVHPANYWSPFFILIIW